MFYRGIAVIGISFITILIGFSPAFSGILAIPVTKNMEHNKAVILNFDDGRKSQFTNAKPILDKYGFKATFYVVCNYLDNKKGYMNWREVETLHKEGHDIGSHTMNHVHLSNLSKNDIKYEVGQSMKCLEDQGIETTSFAYPFNDGSDDEKIVKIVSKYYNLARTANDPITYLRCDDWKDQSIQTDCRTTTDWHHLTYANAFTIKGWSHDFSRLINSYSNSEMFDRFIEVVNIQNKYNEDGVINAIPIVIYHRIGEAAGVDYNTDLDLFEKEMKYLHDNNFRVLTMKDLRFNEMSKDLYIEESTTPKMNMVKVVPNATTKATVPSMVKVVPNATNIEAVLMDTSKNTTSIVSKQPSNVALHGNATSIEMANKVIDAASLDSLNAHVTLTNPSKNTTSIVSKQP